MNDNMGKITLLDSCCRDKFATPVRRIVSAKDSVYRRYHSKRKQRDLSSEYEASQAWEIVTLCYSGIEQAMKCLLKMQGTYIDKPLQKKGQENGHRHHDIRKLFADLADEEKNFLRCSYDTYRSLYYPNPVDNFPTTVDAFLAAIGGGYVAWRYFLSDPENDKNVLKTSDSAMLEMWHALCQILQSRLYENHKLPSIERMIIISFRKDERAALVKHSDIDNQCVIADIERWIREIHKNVVINAYADLFFQDAESSIDLIEVLPSTRTILIEMVEIAKDKWIDRDFDHFRLRSRRGNVTWNPDTGLFEEVAPDEEIEIKLIEPEGTYVDDLAGLSVKIDHIKSAPDYIEDFIFDSRDVGGYGPVDEDKAREMVDGNLEIVKYEGRNECEGYRCSVQYGNGATTFILVLYDSKEWIVYRYHNDDVPGVPRHCKDIEGKFGSIREAIRAIEHFRRTEHKKLEEWWRKHMWNRRGKRRNKGSWGDS